MPGATASTGQAAAGVEAVLAEVFAGLAELGELAAALPRSASAEHRAPTTEDLAALRPAPAEGPEPAAPACRLPLGADRADRVGLPWSLVRV